MPERKSQPLTVRELAELIGCPFEGDGDVEITGAAGLENAGPGDLVFLTQAKMMPLLEASGASAAVLPPGISFERIPVLRSPDPHRAFVKAVELLWRPYRPAPGVHPSAVVASSARLGRDVSIGALAVVGEEAEIGDRTVVFPLVSIYPRVKIGKDCILHSHVSLREGARIGDRVVLHNGAVVGSDGFGYLEEKDGARRKIPQKGTVVIEDDVEIGANAAVDRAALGATVIGRGTKIDNLVQVAHNVTIGADSVLAGQAGVAGSSRLGRKVILSGQVGVTDHVSVGDEAIVAAKSGVTKDIPPGAFVSGSPHLDIREWRKFWASAPRLHDLVKESKRLAARVAALEAENQKKR